MELSERCLFVHESNDTRVVFHVDDNLICAKPATLEKILDADHEVGRDQERRSSQPQRSCGFSWDSSIEVYTMVIAEERKGGDDAFEGTEELESTR